MTEYAVPTAELIGRFGGEYVVRAPGVETLEGGLFDGASAVILQMAGQGGDPRLLRVPRISGIESGESLPCRSAYHDCGDPS